MARLKFQFMFDCKVCYEYIPGTMIESLCTLVRGPACSTVSKNSFETQRTPAKLSAPRCGEKHDWRLNWGFADRTTVVPVFASRCR